MPSITPEKIAYAEKLNSLLDQYSKVLFCQIDNVRSQQLHKIRIALRGKGAMLVGKNTLQKKVFSMRAEQEDASESDKQLAAKLCEDNMLVGNLALIFTNETVASVDELLKSFRVQAPARIGAISPVDVSVPAGNTGLEPTLTSFFQALNIQTKISKGAVEITAEKQVLSVGDKVDNSTAALLQKLNISPFFYAAEIKFFWENGLMFTSEDLQLTDAVFEEDFSAALANLSAVSLATGILTETSFPHAIMDGFKTLLGASIATDYVFEEFNGAQLRTDVIEGKVAPVAEAAAGGAAEAAAAPAEEEEEDDDFGMGGLF